ncbi:MAG TPA: nuclease-related domain-containing protein [Bacillus sp. (in: firmicutes)]|uniref:nuclease-related domain-containing protein n=1 Tax=Bacillus litorisediminis TaxID=2922713 RepID=UPI001FAE5268|nr:nuclease-related domain-containing protein [Bacillus litorisediminis]HWO75398.1 nuclease-related domain-containing protein [Bacillus sp. (in: firmicutes)]
MSDKLKILGGALTIIEKIRTEALSFDGLDAAISRLPNHHPKFKILKDRHTALESGIGGEKRVEDTLRSHSLPFENRIFFDLHLFSTENFQLDAIILTPSYVLILEIKNISGILSFNDDPPHLMRTNSDGSKDGFDSPVPQLERNCELLSKWLSKKSIDLPVFGAIVLAYPKQIVDKSPAATTILYPKLIPAYIKKLFDEHRSKSLDKKSFHRLISEIMRSHSIYVPNPIADTYGISKNDFKTGVKCKECGIFGMRKYFKKWVCDSCGNRSGVAHYHAMKDWFLLFGARMTNRDCREFLGVDNKHKATRILQSMDLKHEGSFRDRVYWMDLRTFKIPSE